MTRGRGGGWGGQEAARLQTFLFILVSLEKNIGNMQSHESTDVTVQDKAKISV